VLEVNSDVSAISHLHVFRAYLTPIPHNRHRLLVNDSVTSLRDDIDLNSTILIQSQAFQIENFANTLESLGKGINQTIFLVQYDNRICNNEFIIQPSLLHVLPYQLPLDQFELDGKVILLHQLLIDSAQDIISVFTVTILNYTRSTKQQKLDLSSMHKLSKLLNYVILHSLLPQATIISMIVMTPVEILLLIDNKMKLQKLILSTRYLCVTDSTLLQRDLCVTILTPHGFTFQVQLEIAMTMKDALRKFSMYTDSALHVFTYFDHILTPHININWLNKTNLITAHKQITSCCDVHLANLKTDIRVQVVTSFPFYFHLDLKKGDNAEDILFALSHATQIPPKLITAHTDRSQLNRYSDLSCLHNNSDLFLHVIPFSTQPSLRHTTNPLTLNIKLPNDSMVIVELPTYRTASQIIHSIHQQHDFSDCYI